MHPVPTVPEPITSPGMSLVSRLAWAKICGQVQYIELAFPRETSLPLISAVMTKPNRPWSYRSISDAIGTHRGPNALAQSLPLAGPNPTAIQLESPARRNDQIAVPEDGIGVREVKNRDLVPLRDHVQSALGSAGPHVLFEGIEIADRANFRYIGGRFHWKLPLSLHDEIVEAQEHSSDHGRGGQIGSVALRVDVQVPDSQVLLDRLGVGQEVIALLLVGLPENLRFGRGKTPAEDPHAQGFEAFVKHFGGGPRRLGMLLRLKYDLRSVSGRFDVLRVVEQYQGLKRSGRRLTAGGTRFTTRRIEGEHARGRSSASPKGVHAAAIEPFALGLRIGFARPGLFPYPGGLVGHHARSTDFGD